MEEHIKTLVGEEKIKNFLQCHEIRYKSQTWPVINDTKYINYTKRHKSKLKCKQAIFDKNVFP